MRASRLAVVAYVVLAVVATWPLALRATDHVFGVATPPLNVWAMGFVLHQLPRAPLDLFDGNAFHPYPRSLAFSEHLFVPSLLGSPVVLLTGNLVLAHNVVALLTLALAGLGMYRLALHLTGDAPGAFIAGVFYAFHTWNVNELIRIQILSNEWFPFLLLALVRFFESPSGARARAVGAFALLQGLSCMYWALYLPILLAPAILFLGVRARTPFRSLVPLGASLAAAALVVGLFFVPYVRNARELGHVREDPEPVALDRYLDVRPGNLLYARLLGTAPRGNENAAHFLGFAALGLALAGAAARRPEGDRLRRLRPLLIGLAAAGLLLSLGVRVRIGSRTVGPGPYALFRRAVPGFDRVRYPERFSLFVVLGLAPLAAAGVQRLRSRIGPVGIASIGVLVFVEHLAIPLRLEPLPPGSRLPEVYRSLVRDPRVSVVAEVPASRYHAEREDAWPMYASTVHWKRTLQGFTGYFPPSYNFTRWRLFHFPAPESVRFLEGLGVDSVVVHPGPGGPPEWATTGPGWDAVPFDDGYRLLRLEAPARGFEAPAADPTLVELDHTGWRVQASWPGAERAIDGDPRTTWTTGEAQGKGDFYRVTLPHPVVLGRISIDVRPPYEFPMRLKVLGEDDYGWQEIPYDEGRAYDGLFASLLRRPLDPRLDIDLPGRTLKALRLRITETDAYWMPWTMADLRLYARR